MATQMQLELILAGNCIARLATRVNTKGKLFLYPRCLKY